VETAYFQAINQTTGQVIASRVKIAQDFQSRSTGLLNRSSLDEDEGLLIKPCNSIHTFFMKFPIDVLFLDQKGKVVRIGESIKPWRLFGALFKGYMVLEVCAGRLKQVRTTVGDSIKISAT
jgi:uncharacterized membrane protein (UPF0127 family)